MVRQINNRTPKPSLTPPPPLLPAVDKCLFSNSQLSHSSNVFPQCRLLKIHLIVGLPPLFVQTPFRLGRFGFRRLFTLNTPFPIVL
ncbi:unnamed protein product [Rodentolepis nana]|uniref:Uncharacterized protein n=1 Tax=Rodentolepis nana TaxID=102285 RepID=A0A3P7T0L9_RODNA|nr:unnamed protein product [Rodentolepis nana]